MLRPSASGQDFDRVDNTSHPHDILKLYHTDRVINIKNKNIIDNIFFLFSDMGNPQPHRSRAHAKDDCNWLYYKTRHLNICSSFFSYLWAAEGRHNNFSWHPLGQPE